MKKGLWKRRAFAFLVAAAMVIPQGVYAAETEGNETPENAITEEVPERVHENGCTLPSDHEGDCVTTPAENTEEPTERVHEEGCILPSDHEGECEVEEMPLQAPKAGDVLTVHENGEDGAYTSLADAVAAAANGDTIELKSDLTSKKYALISGKNITIIGNGHTITRGENFTRVGDQARGGYHPAMIEVANGAKLTLIDITLDDAMRAEADKFLEQVTGEVNKDNENKVQDAIIAAYRGGGTIELGDKATLKNFGGMSAVRIGGPGQD